MQGVSGNQARNDCMENFSGATFVSPMIGVSKRESNVGIQVEWLPTKINVIADDTFCVKDND